MDHLRLLLLSLALVGAGVGPAAADATVPAGARDPRLERCAAAIEEARREVGLHDEQQRPVVRAGAVSYREEVAEQCLVEDVYAAVFQRDRGRPSAWRWREARRPLSSDPDIVSHVIVGERRFGGWAGRVVVELRNEPQPPVGPEPRLFRRAFARALEACAAAVR